MSLSSLTAAALDSRPDALSSLTAETAAALLSALPVRSTLSDVDHEDARSVAVIVAAASLADGRTLADSVAYAWRAALTEATRDAAHALPIDSADLADTVRPVTLSRSATPDPAAPFRTTPADVLTMAIVLARESDDRTGDLLDVIGACRADSWHGGLPTREALASTAALLRVKVNPRTVRADAAAALAIVADYAETVTAWVSYAHPAAVTWTEDGRTLADALAVPSGLPSCNALHPTSQTGESMSGPASAVVIRHRDTLADAWHAVTETYSEAVETDDGPEMVERETVTLRSLTESRAAETLADAHAVKAYRRTAAVMASDGWADRLAWSPGRVAKPSRKPSRVGSTGPTVPVRLSR